MADLERRSISGSNNLLATLWSTLWTACGPVLGNRSLGNRSQGNRLLYNQWIIIGISLGISLFPATLAGAHDWAGRALAEHPAATPARAEPAATAPGCQALHTAFARFPDTVSASCTRNSLIIDAPTGLPPESTDERDRLMVGIQAWIQRVPVPVSYHWQLPVRPDYLATPANPSPRGPIAVAIDGVPIFHWSAPPDWDTSPEAYNPRYDTALVGELDQCGGHVGQGNEYHYHYVPVCLVSASRLNLPIAVSLGGIPIFFGTGGTDFYGRGRTSKLDNLPNLALDSCNGLRLDDGSYVYYTTKTPPYVIGCHHAHLRPNANIDVRPMQGQDQGQPSPLGGQYGEPARTRVTDFHIDREGWRHMEFRSLFGSGMSAVRYRPTARAGCWEFDYRIDAGQPGERLTSCR